MTAGRRVYSRAILTAFSVASAPVESSSVFFGDDPGARRLRASATATYGSYVATWKQVWVNRLACSAIASTIFGCAWPTFSVPMPPTKSMYDRPVSSQTRAPAPRSMTRGWATETPRGTAADRRSTTFCVLIVSIGKEVLRFECKRCGQVDARYVRHNFTALFGGRVQKSHV